MPHQTQIKLKQNIQIYLRFLRFLHFIFCKIKDLNTFCSLQTDSFHLRSWRRKG